MFSDLVDTVLNFLAIAQRLLAETRENLYLRSPKSAMSGLASFGSFFLALTLRTEEGDERLQLMTDIIVAKLQQHPKLIEAIALRGGVAWLESCEHTVGARNSYWEGIGRNSPFIVCLIAAYSFLLSCNAVATPGCITVGSMRNLLSKLGFVDIVCDRTSVLGNPFDMQGDEQKRDTVCDAFRQWLWQNIKLASTSSNAVVDLTEWKLPVAKTWYKPTSTQVWEELNKITNLVRAGTNVRLLCWCKQTNKNVRCHADTIKACIEWMINKSERQYVTSYHALLTGSFIFYMTLKV